MTVPYHSQYYHQTNTRCDFACGEQPLFGVRALRTVFRVVEREREGREKDTLMMSGFINSTSKSVNQSHKITGEFWKITSMKWGKVSYTTRTITTDCHK